MKTLSKKRKRCIKKVAYSDGDNVVFVKPKPTTIKNPQANSPVERIHKVVMNMFTTKNLTGQVFDYIDPWGEILSSIAWAIRASHHSTLGATPAQ